MANKKRVTIKSVLEKLEKETGKKYKIVPHYSERYRKWTVKAVEDK